MEKIPVAIVGLEPGTPVSVVQCFNPLATKQPKPDCSLTMHEVFGGVKRKVIVGLADVISIDG